MLILGQEATRFGDSEPPVYLLPDGRFAVEYGDKWVTRKTLATALKLVGSKRRAVRLMAFVASESYYTRTEVRTANVVECDKRHVVTQEGKKLYLGFNEQWFLYDAEIAAKLKDFYQRREKADRAFVAELRAIARKAVQVHSGNLDAMLAKFGRTD